MLTYNEFQHIMSIQKNFIDCNIKFCKIGDNISYDLISISNSNKKFKLDVDRRTRSIELNKIKIQNRLDIPLIRVDINSPPHINPDRTKTSRNHIHIYKEGYDLKWAMNLEGFHSIYFKNTNIFNNLFIDFCKYCNIDISKLNNFQGVI
ncbi:MAG: DUF6978 family protein [Lachnospirales bacterium]